jgi:ribonuclease H / adenosylcobalamin/alpha-ribazole phosphatase
MTRLIVLASGETEWDLQGWLGSETDAALSERGLAQAERAAWSLRRVSLDLVLSAPGVRARTTAARVVSGRVAPRVEVDARLRELGFGPFEGLAPRAPGPPELLAAYDAWCEESAFAPAGCEPFTSAARRARSLVADVSRTHGTVLLVTHHVFARILIVAAVLGLPAHAYGRIRLDRGALAEIRLDPALPPQLVGANLRAPVAQLAGDEARHPTTDRVRDDRHEGGSWGRAAAN